MIPGPVPSSPPPAMSTASNRPTGPQEQLGLFLRGLDHRGRLAALETAAAGDHLAGTLLLAAGAFGLILLTGITLTFTLAASVWHLEERGWILGGAALGQLGIAALLARVALRRWRAWDPLPATRHQFGEDCRLIGELMPGGDDHNNR
ncbi:MAG: phage holin family protein [Verrucomicrobiota bacterium]